MLVLEFAGHAHDSPFLLTQSRGLWHCLICYPSFLITVMRGGRPLPAVSLAARRVAIIGISFSLSLWSLLEGGPTARDLCRQPAT